MDSGGFGVISDMIVITPAASIAAGVHGVRSHVSTLGVAACKLQLGAEQHRNRAHAQHGVDYLRCIIDETNLHTPADSDNSRVMSSVQGGRLFSRCGAGSRPFLKIICQHVVCRVLQ